MRFFAATLNPIRPEFYSLIFRGTVKKVSQDSMAGAV
jgi:hypothetical protein